MIENEMMDSGTPAPRLGGIRVGPHFQLEVTWAAGKRAGHTEIIDLWPAINRYKIYRPLRADRSLFATARLLDDGYVVEWNGRDLEMSADLIDALVTQALSSADLGGVSQAQ
jgi:hypothetical protein